MTEQYGFKFVVDANDAARGWKQFETAVEGVFKALDKMESHVDKTMAAVNSGSRKAAGGMKAFNDAASGLKEVKFNGSSTKNITALNAAMRSFKAPSASQAKNLQTFFKALAIAGTGGGAAAARNIGALSAAMSGFKAPSATNVRNTRDFFAALATFRNNGLRNAAGMFSTLRQISGFKAPSATQVKNLQSFINSVSNLQIPRNGSQIASVLTKIAAAASASNASLRGLRGGVGSFNWGRFNSGAHSAAVNMMGLQNAFSATYQIGSVLRSLLGSLTIAELGRSFFEADNRLVTFSASMKVISNDAQFANQQLQFVTDTARRLGLDYGSAAEAFGKFSISADQAGATVAQTRVIFEGFGTAMSVMGLSADKQTDVMLALQQVMNKGYLAGEELNQQLNEHLPGALGALRKELAKTGVSLQDALKNKMIDGVQGLLFLAKFYKDKFGPAMAEALNRPAAQMNIFRTGITKLFEQIAKNGGNDGFTKLLKRINAYMRPEDLERYGKAIGELISKYMNKLGNALDWLAKNWDSIKGPLSTAVSLLGKFMVVSGLLKIGQFITSPLIGMGTTLTGLIPKLRQMYLLTTALSATSMIGPPTQLAAMNAATVASYFRLSALKKVLTTMPKNPFASIVSGSKSLLSAVLKIPKGFIGAAVGVGVFQAAMQGAMSTNDELAAKNYTTTEVISGYFSIMGDKVSSIWSRMTKYMRENWGFTFINLADVMSGFGKFIGNFFINLAFGMQKFVKGIYLAFKSVFQGIFNQIALLGTALAALFSGDFAGAGKAAKDMVTGKGFKESFGQNFEGFFSNIGAQRDQFAGDVYRGFDAAGARGRGPGDRKAPADQTTNEMVDNLYDPTKLLSGKGDKDKDKKHKGRKHHAKKGPDPEKELDKLESRIDGIMKRLAEDNPLLKLQQDFVSDLTEQAQLLLTKGGYQEWLKTVADSSGDATVAMSKLNDELLGAGGNQKVLKDIAARYGITVDQLTEALEKQNNAYLFKQKQLKIEAQFGGKLIQDATQQVQLAKASASQAQILGQVLDEVNRYKAMGNELDQQAIDKLTERLTLQERHIQLLNAERDFYENNGLNDYVKGIQTAGEAVHELDKNFLGSLEEQLTSLGTTGKFSIQSLFDTIQGGLIKFASQGITGAIGNLLSDKDPKNPSIFGGLFKAMGFNSGFDQKTALQRIDAANVTLYAARVNTQGEYDTGALGAILGGKGAGVSSGPEDIVVNAYKSTTLEEEIKKPLISATDAVGQLMGKDWSQKVRGIGGLFQQIIGSVSGGGGSGGGAGGIFGSLLNIGMSFLGGGGSSLSSLVPDVTKTIAANPGIFKEGGYSNSPVARASGMSFTNAPHYAEGTHNTNGGMPAILHDNEAVIPLSRGRKVPVTLTNENSRGSGTVVNNTWHVQTPDADSFKRSQQQMTNQMSRAAHRANTRNN